MQDLADQLPRPIAFVLGGGGSMGAMQVGMLKALDEHQIRPDIVVGTSIGALNGAIVAANPIAAAGELVQLWSNIKSRRILVAGMMSRLRNLFRRRPYLLENVGIERMLAQSVQASRIEDLSLPYGAVAVDVETAHVRTITRGSLSSAVLGSAAIPGVFAPVEHEGRYLYDGGLVANVPVNQALEMGAESLVVLDCVFADRAAPFPTTLVSAMVYSATVTMRQQVLRELPAAAERVPVVYLPGAEPILISPLNFRKSVPLIAEAYEESRRFLSQLKVTGPGLYRASELHAPRRVG